MAEVQLRKNLPSLLRPYSRHSPISAPFQRLHSDPSKRQEAASNHRHELLWFSWDDLEAEKLNGKGWCYQPRLMRVFHLIISTSNYGFHSVYLRFLWIIVYKNPIQLIGLCILWIKSLNFPILTFFDSKHLSSIQCWKLLLFK